jgi:hypothetical protein
MRMKDQTALRRPSASTMVLGVDPLQSLMIRPLARRHRSVGAGISYGPTRSACQAFGRPLRIRVSAIALPAHSGTSRTARSFSSGGDSVGRHRLHPLAEVGASDLLNQERRSAVRSDAFRRYAARGFLCDTFHRCTSRCPQIGPCTRMPAFRKFGS